MGGLERFAPEPRPRTPFDGAVGVCPEVMESLGLAAKARGALVLVGARERRCVGRLLVAPPLYEDVEDVVVLIHRAPQVMALTVNGQKDFIQVPFVPGLRATAP